MTRTDASAPAAAGTVFAAPEVDVVIEIPRWSFLKRGSTGRIDFVSPLPCPFNYGAIPQYLGQEGDLLDAVVLGPRLPAGTRLRVRAWGAVILMDRGMTDDKLICSVRPVDPGAAAAGVAVLPLLREVQGAPQPLAAATRPQRLRRLVRSRRGARTRPAARRRLARSGDRVLIAVSVRASASRRLLFRRACP